jgi:hypothetical protein
LQNSTAPAGGVIASPIGMKGLGSLAHPKMAKLAQNRMDDQNMAL